MKKLVLMSRNWIKVAASKTVGGLRDLIDGFSSGGTPFVPIALPHPFSPEARREYDSMRAQQDFAYRTSLAGQGAMMGGFGGQLLERLMGYRPYETKPIALQEGKVSVHVSFTRIDKEHVLVEVECIRRIVHNKKELREVTATLIEEYAEAHVFNEQPKAVGTRDLSGAMGTTREPPGGDEEVMKK